MKKAVLILAVIAALGVAGFMLMNKKDEDKTNQPSNTDQTTTNNQTSFKNACDLLTLDDAKVLIGENATLVAGSGEPTAASTDDVKVDNCTYSADGATLGDLKQITVQVHSGNSQLVRESYQNYKVVYSGDAISDLGDEAFFATEAKQANFVKSGVWVTSFGGSINAGDESNKELSIQVARKVAEKL